MNVRLCVWECHGVIVCECVCHSVHYILWFLYLQTLCWAHSQILVQVWVSENTNRFLTRLPHAEFVARALKRWMCTWPSPARFWLAWQTYQELSFAILLHPKQATVPHCPRHPARCCIRCYWEGCSGLDCGIDAIRMDIQVQIKCAIKLWLAMSWELIRTLMARGIRLTPAAPPCPDCLRMWPVYYNCDSVYEITRNMSRNHDPTWHARSLDFAAYWIVRLLKGVMLYLLSHLDKKN